MYDTTCNLCHGLIMEPGKFYGYPDKVCRCGLAFPPKGMPYVQHVHNNITSISDRDLLIEIRDLLKKLIESNPKERE